MKKRILSLVLAIAVVLTFTACGNTTSTSNSVSEEPVASVSASTEPAPSVEPVTSTDPDEGVPLSEWEQKIFPIYRYYANYFAEGFNFETGHSFASPEGNALVYSPCISFVDINEDGIEDVIISGDFGIRNKQITLVYYYSDDDGAFYETYFYGTPYAVSDGCILVIDEDNDGPSLYYTDMVVYSLEADYAHDILRYAMVEDFTEDADAALLTETYYVNGEESDAEEYGILFAPYYNDMKTISYDELTEDVAAALFAVG